MNLQERVGYAHSRSSRSEKKDLVAHWREKEPLDKGSDPVEAFSLIFRTRGCFWSYDSGCTMCGYYTDTNPKIEREYIEDQLEKARSEYSQEDIVKIYTSGSFLDESEIPEELALKILDSFDAKKIVVESRPEFIEPKKIKLYSDRVEELEVAIGLESTNDFVLENSINKGFTFQDYRETVESLTDISIRTYLLLKPPFLLEKEAIDDVVSSIKTIEHLTDVVSLNPVNVQRGSLLEKLWKKKLYRPPWIWSIGEVISRSKTTENLLVVSEAGVSSKRGAHNCGKCDEELKSIINRFNLSQDNSLFSNLPECSCKERWKKESKIEPFLFFRGTPQLLRHRYTGDL